ncbi:serine/arginine repetitive matrix protein 3-like [Cebus imitator]|uniref:serine/arginine repetitive matrix protein 3-like n=1 Tax=Cebus imitator TaxID=2715852 RepID=UPI00189BC07C|nr:serine/arginine repetitive matrix protein 3-like [Cebus imitator]
MCACVRAREERARGGGRGAAHSRAPRPLRRGGGGGGGGGRRRRKRRRKRRRRRRRRKWLSAAGRIKSNQTRPENCVQEGSDRRRMGKGEQLTAFETSRKKDWGQHGERRLPAPLPAPLRRTLGENLVSRCRALAPGGRCEPASRKVLLKSGSFL